MKHYSRILFVDADDTARAPMAKAILQSKELPWPMEIGSRGLVVLFPQPVNQKVEAVLARNGLSAKDHTLSLIHINRIIHLSARKALR